MITGNPELKVQLVCFDLDGTIADTEPLHRRAQTKIARSIGYTGPIDHDGAVGKPSSFFWTPILAALGRGEDLYPVLDQEKEDAIIKLAEEERLPPSDGLSELLESLSARGILASVCTSSTRAYAEGMLRVLGLADRFAFVIGGDEVAERKPAPDLYLASLRHFGVDASAALAIEDTSAGVAAAKAAGMRCAGYINPTSGDQDLSRADLQIHSMRELLADYSAADSARDSTSSTTAKAGL